MFFLRFESELRSSSTTEHKIIVDFTLTLFFVVTKIKALVGCLGENSKL